MGKVTIEDISRHTNLSRGTISRALNDRPDISLATKQRVLEACRQLNYVPSHAARALATGRCYAVAVVVDDVRAGFAGSFLRGVLCRAQTENYLVHVSELGGDARVAVDHLCKLAGERVDAVLLATALPGDLARQLTQALDLRPLVACGPVDGAECDLFIPDQVESGRLVGRHLLHGHPQNVVYVHQPGSAAACERLAGFQEICRERHLVPEQLTIEIDPGASDRLAPVRERLGPLRALAASDDFLAIELMLLCRAAGRDPGRDIAIMGQGNEIVGARVAPTLTTIDPCGEEIGRRAMDTAIQRAMKTRQDAPQETRVPPILMPRDSTRLPGGL